MASYIRINAKSSDFSSLSYYISILLHKISFGFLILLSVVLIIFSKVNISHVEQTRQAVYFIATPMIYVIEKPVNFSLKFIKSIKISLTLSEENKKLKAENLFFKKRYLESLNIKSENDELKKLLNFATTSENFEYKTAYIKGNVAGYDSNNIILLSGEEEDFKQGYAVSGYNGMIGRVFSVSERKSRIILITDLNSKIPVIIVGKNKRNKAILSGNNSKHPEIVYLTENHGIQKGDKVFTSGDGGVLPSGLYIGDVISVNEEDGKVLPVEDFNNIDMVLVLEKIAEEDGELKDIKEIEAEVVKTREVVKEKKEKVAQKTIAVKKKNDKIIDTEKITTKKEIKEE